MTAIVSRRYISACVWFICMYVQGSKALKRRPVCLPSYSVDGSCRRIALLCVNISFTVSKVLFSARRRSYVRAEWTRFLLTSSATLFMLWWVQQIVLFWFCWVNEVAASW